MFEKEIAANIAAASAGAVTAAEAEAALEVPKDKKMGDLALPCFKFARTLKKAPPVIAKELADALSLPDVVERAETAGGYLNFYFPPVRYANVLRRLRTESGTSPAGSAKGKGRQSA